MSSPLSRPAVVAAFALGAALPCFSGCALPAATAPVPLVSAAVAPADLAPVQVADAGWPLQAPLLFELDGEAAIARRGGLALRADAHGLELRLSDGRGGALRVALRVEGGDSRAEILAEGPPRARVHRYSGSDSVAWRSDLPAHAAVTLRELRPGLDLHLRDGGGLLEYDLRVAPDAVLEDLVFRLEGARSLSLRADGALVAATAAGELVQQIPACWQEGPDGQRSALSAHFVLLPDAADGTPRFGFRSSPRTPGAVAVVDPTLSYASFLGGALWDRATSLAALPDGGVVVCGFTVSPGFPVTPGAEQGALAGYGDAFVSRFGPDGGLVWSTFLGGNDPGFLVFDAAADVAVAADGSLALAGWANSADFPTTPGAFARIASGDMDGFVARLDADGALVWSSFLGGSLRDEALAVAFAPGGDVVVGGHTFSKGANGSGAFPTTPGAFDTQFSSIFLTNDAFVTRFAADGSALVWSTLLGGQLRDEVRDLAVDAQGRVLATGLTGSVDFPTTPGAYDTTYNGSSGSETDAFVVRLSPDGSALQWGSFLGGAGLVEGRALALDGSGAPVIAGRTRGPDLPITPGALQPASGGGEDAFVARFSSDGAALAWCTFLGGSEDDEARALVLGPFGEVHVAGFTRSANFPVTPDAAQPQLGGGRDAFLVKLDAHGTALVHGSFLGGTADDEGLALALDPWGAAWLAGGTMSADFPTTAAAFEPDYGGGGDAFLVAAPLPPWFHAGFALAGSGGLLPRLAGSGSLQPGSPGALQLTRARPNAPWMLFVSLSSSPVPFKGGALVPFPWLLSIQLFTLPDGSLPLPFAWPTGLPAGLSIWFQGWIADPGAVQGLSATNALRALQP